MGHLVNLVLGLRHRVAVGREETSEGNARATHRGRTSVGVCGVGKTETVSQQKGPLSRVRDVRLLGHRAEKLTSGHGDAVTADLTSAALEWSREKKDS